MIRSCFSRSLASFVCWKMVILTPFSSCSFRICSPPFPNYVSNFVPRYHHVLSLLSVLDYPFKDRSLSQLWNRRRLSTATKTSPSSSTKISSSSAAHLSEVVDFGSDIIHHVRSFGAESIVWKENSLVTNCWIAYYQKTIK